MRSAMAMAFDVDVARALRLRYRRYARRREFTESDARGGDTGSSIMRVIDY